MDELSASVQRQVLKLLSDAGNVVPSSDEGAALLVRALSDTWARQDPQWKDDMSRLTFRHEWNGETGVTTIHVEGPPDVIARLDFGPSKIPVGELVNVDVTVEGSDGAEVRGT